MSDGAVCRAFHPMVLNVEFFCSTVRYVGLFILTVVLNVEFFCSTVRYVGLFIRWCGMLSFLSDGAVCRAFHPMVWNVKFFVRRCGM